MPPVKAEELEAVLDRDLAAARTPIFRPGMLSEGTEAGVVVGVVQHGVRRVFAFGTAKPDSIFEIGSISKTFTGLILARMVAAGSVKFSDPVRELLPQGTVPKPEGAEITLLDLAIQHSGLPRMPDNFHPADPQNPYAVSYAFFDPKHDCAGIVLFNTTVVGSFADLLGTHVR